MTSRTTTVEERLRKALGPGLLTRELLRHHTTFRIGGPADFFFAALEPDQLVAALKVAHEIRVPVFLLGGGSNLLVSDEGFRGLVVKNACASTEFDGAAVQVGCGADFLELILQCRDRGPESTATDRNSAFTAGGCRFSFGPRQRCMWRSSSSR